jgi:thioredoxin 1
MMSNQNVLELNDLDFKKNVESGVALVDFWAPWCGPCRMQGPIVDRVADHVNSIAKVIKVDVDQAQSVAMQFGVQSIPTLVILKDGKLVESFVGVQTEATLISAVNRAVNA